MREEVIQLIACNVSLKTMKYTQPPSSEHKLISHSSINALVIQLSHFSKHQISLQGA